jgi:hypothetical protein
MESNRAVGISSPRRARALWSFRVLLVLAILGGIGLFLTANELRSSAGPVVQAAARLQGIGYTLDALTGLPVDAATVSVDGKQFTSDSDGLYNLSGLSKGEKIAVVTRAGRVPTAFHFSVYNFGSVSTSVHTPPAYLVPTQPSIVVPAGGGVVYHGQHELQFGSNTFPITASLTGFGDHPGTPPPPDAIPTFGSPQPPRPPMIPPASSAVRAFPQGIFYAEFTSGNTATARVPLVVTGADPLGTALPLLRFNTGTARWERAGDLSVVSSGFAQGTISQSGLYMVVTGGRILTSTVAPTGQTTDVIAPIQDSSVTFTIPSTFEIDSSTSSDVRPAVFWLYGWREGNGNSTGVRVDFAPLSLQSQVLAGGSGGMKSTRSGAAEPGETGPCPPGFTCPKNTVPCIVPESTINGCGSTVKFGGVCTCCESGKNCQAKVRAGSALDTYDISVGIEEIIRQIKAKGEKRKSDLKIDAGCF